MRLNNGVKLTVETAAWALHAICDDGMPHRVAAHKLGVSMTAVSRLVNGLTWRNVSGPRKNLEEAKAIAAANSLTRLSRVRKIFNRAEVGTTESYERVRISERIEDEGLGSTTYEIGAAIGATHQWVVQLSQKAMKRVHVRLVATAIERELRGWGIDALADIAAYVIRKNLGYQFVTGIITIDEVVDAMSDTDWS